MLVTKLDRWTSQKSAWALLFCISLALVVSALFFQHALGHEPCVMCIYQRTAVIGIMLSALIPLILNHSGARLLGYVGWGISSIWGAMIAREHLDILTAPNPFFAPCPIVPNFPSALPLYDWIPTVFGAAGDCLDQSWQFLGMGMPAWMQLIFAVFVIVWVATVMVKMISRRLKARLG